MFIPSSFRESRITVMHELIQAHPLGLLITHGSAGLQASQLPFFLSAGEGPKGTLRAHLARANPQLGDLAGGVECLVVFQGEQGYVTPSWYASKLSTHETVPTWNYATVQVRGVPALPDDPAWLRQQLNDLTNAQELGRSQPWATGDAPEAYLARQMQAIVGIEIQVSAIEGKWKMSQNKDAADRQGVIDGLRAAGDPHRNPALAGLVAERMKGR